VTDPTSRTALLAGAEPVQPITPQSDRKAARRARRAELRTTAVDPLLTADEAAVETGRAVSTFGRDVKRGSVPAPYYVTPRAPRWRQSELQAAVDASPRLVGAKPQKSATGTNDPT
jgi:predicted DNA-binding transcriptional regulator AlpA